MKFVKLHSRNTTIVYKNSLCSSAGTIVFLFVIISILLPVFLVLSVIQTNEINERVHFEKPTMNFKFKYILIANFKGDENEKLIACSTFPYLNKFKDLSPDLCSRIKFWSEDFDFDGVMDNAHFELQIPSLNEKLEKFYLVLFFEAVFNEKCIFSPESILLVEHNFRCDGNEKVIVKGNIALVQKNAFHCPIFGEITHPFHRNEILSINETNIEEFSLENIRKNIKLNEGYIEMQSKEVYSKKNSENGHMSIEVEFDIGQLPVRYQVGPWEHIGLSWLYFASFFGLSVYICNRIKDFLFSKHWVNSWEIIPWK